MYHSFLIHSSADGHLGCFYVLAIINSAAMNIGVHVSLSDLVSSVCMPRSGIAGSYGSSISSFLIGLGALGRPRGIGWRGRWEGGSGWGIHVNPWLIYVNVWQKPLQYCKVISLQLIKINGGKKKEKLKKKKEIMEVYLSWFWRLRKSKSVLADSASGEGLIPLSSCGGRKGEGAL